MDYLVLAETYEKLENESAKLGKRDIVVELLNKTPSSLLSKVVLLLVGRVFASYSGEELGIAEKMMTRAISKVSGFSNKNVVKKFREKGDLGKVADECIKSKRQSTLSKRKLTVDKVFESVQKLATISGKGAQDKKLNLIAELLTSAKPKEAIYIVRTILGTLRIGVAEGIIRDAVAKAFDVDAKVVENAWNLNADYGEIARIAKEKGEKGLKNVSVELGKPIQVLLAQKSDGLEEALKKFEHPVLEFKYDGMRAEIHKKGDKVWIFTRRLENVSEQFPDLVRFTKSSVKAKECIIEGEVIGINKETGNPLPFQQLSQRVQRKYDIEKMVEEIPVQIHLFDITYLDGEPLFDKPLKERRELLEKSVKKIPDKFLIAKQLVTKDLKDAEKFYGEALNNNQEGLIVKNLESKYQPGRRVGFWLKVKPTMEHLDLVVIGADWGTGKRANWLSSYILACRDPNTGEFLECGMLGTGLTDKQFKEMTEKLKPLITEEKGRRVKIKPKVVVEVAYEEIQKSPHYDSGYALRFPRLIRERTQDKGTNEADNIERVRKLFKSQGKHG
jgi:DNA ligase-1